MGCHAICFPMKKESSGVAQLAWRDACTILPELAKGGGIMAGRTQKDIKRMQYRSNGVPVLRDEEIEENAYRLLCEVDPVCIHTPARTPIPSILQYLIESHDLKLSISDSLGCVNGRKIRGKTILSQNMICLDDDIIHNDEALFFMTAAYEIGHWRLHRHRKITRDDGEENIDVFEDGEYSFWDQDELRLVTKKKELITAIDWLEHHAKVFAASLLMPRTPFIEAVVLIQRDMGINRNFGKVYLYDDPVLNKDFFNTIKGLQDIFGTSKQAVSIRIRELGILIDCRKQHPELDKEWLRAFSFEKEKRVRLV
jgi:hypothetical protein